MCCLWISSISQTLLLESGWMAGPQSCSVLAPESGTSWDTSHRAVIQTRSSMWLWAQAVKLCSSGYENYKPWESENAYCAFTHWSTNDFFFQKSSIFIELCLPLGSIALEMEMLVSTVQREFSLINNEIENWKVKTIKKKTKTNFFLSVKYS